MDEQQWIVAPADESPDTLNELERWLRDDGLGSGLNRTEIGSAAPGVGSQGGVLEAIGALLDTSGVSILIRSLFGFAAALYARKPRTVPEFHLKHAKTELVVEGNMTKAQIDELIRIAQAAFGRQIPAGSRE
jgi:hypothetical protein